MASCKNCGSNLKSVAGGYKCPCCGSTFAESDLSPAVGVSSMSAAVANSGADIYEKNIGGVLEIYWQDSKGLNSGSGFLISADGYCITNTHVVTEKSGKSIGQCSVKINGETRLARVLVLGDDRHGDGRGVDLALIKLDRVPFGAKVMEFDNFSNVRIGESVYVIGNSLGYGTCITSGIVSDKERNVNGQRLLMTDCAVNGGNSGGPIFNGAGRVIGAIVSSIPSAKGMNFAIPSSTIEKFVDSCRCGIRIKKA